MRNSKYKYEYVEELIESKGGLLISDTYLGTNGYITTMCKYGHTWSAQFSKIRAGGWCPECSIRSRMLTIEHVSSAIKDKGGLLLSTEYSGCEKKLYIQCLECYGMFGMSYNTIKQNRRWCPHCAKKIKQNNRMEFIRKTIEDLGGKLLTTTYKTSRESLEVVCEYGHIWHPRFGNIQSNGAWCIECAGSKRYKIGYVKKIISGLGGILLSTEYINNKKPLKIKCNKCERIWTPTFEKVMCGRWCPSCSIGKSQRNLEDIIKSLFPKYKLLSNYRKFEWLHNKDTNGRQEVDVWLPEIKLAIEYDGRQHFEPVEFGGISYEAAVANYEALKQRDQRKNRLIAEHPEDVKYFIRFNYKEKITEGYVREKLIKSGAIIKE